MIEFNQSLIIEFNRYFRLEDNILGKRISIDAYSFSQCHNNHVILCYYLLFLVFKKNKFSNKCCSLPGHLEWEKRVEKTWGGRVWGRRRGEEEEEKEEEEKEAPQGTREERAAQEEEEEQAS